MTRAACLTSARTVLQILVSGVLLTLVGCSGDVNFNPVAPTSPFTPIGAMRTLEIGGTLAAERGSALEATVLYDGLEVPGARVVCDDDRGCQQLALQATTRSAGGNHTISFRVLNQSLETVDYMAQGSVRVSRDGLATVVTMPLNPTRATLRAGESVNFTVTFVN